MKMTERTQSFQATALNGKPILRVNTRGTRPSWKTFGKGSGHVEFRFDRIRKAIEIEATEVAYANKPTGRDLQKRVFVQVDQEAAEQLYELLGSMLGKTTTHGS